MKTQRKRHTISNGSHQVTGRQVPDPRGSKAKRQSILIVTLLFTSNFQTHFLNSLNPYNPSIDSDFATNESIRVTSPLLLIISNPQDFRSKPLVPETPPPTRKISSRSHPPPKILAYPSLPLSPHSSPHLLPLKHALSPLRTSPQLRPTTQTSPPLPQPLVSHRPPLIPLTLPPPSTNRTAD